MTTRWLALVVENVSVVPPVAVPLRPTKPAAPLKICVWLVFALNSSTSAPAADAQRPARTARAGAATRRGRQPRGRMILDMSSLPRATGVQKAAGSRSRWTPQLFGADVG